MISYTWQHMIGSDKDMWQPMIGSDKATVASDISMMLRYERKHDIYFWHFERAYG